MLYDPKWDVKEVTTPTISDFIGWLRTKNPSEEYDYTSATNCAYIQFLKQTGRADADYHCGPSDIPPEFNNIVHPFAGAGFLRTIWRSMNGASRLTKRGWTFGDALRRAKKAA